MIVYVQGNLFDSGADALVNTVNTNGVMGKGLAYQFKSKFPLNYQDYKKVCAEGDLVAGGLHITKLGDEPTVINFATKGDWKNQSKIEYVENGCAELREYLLKTPSVKSVAVPPLGCANGGLAWSPVKAIIEKYLSDLPTKIIVYEPSANGLSRTSAPPKLGVEALIVLKVSNKLNQFNSANLKAAIALLNKEGTVIAPARFSGICESIAAYKKYYSYSNEEAEQALYLQICSYNVDVKVASVSARIDAACDAVNKGVL